LTHFWGFARTTIVLFHPLAAKNRRPARAAAGCGDHPTSNVKDESTIFLQVSDEGTYYWKKGVSSAPELISVSEIGPAPPKLQDQRANPRVLIRGDNKARFGAAVLALDEVRKAAIEQVSIETIVSQTGR